MWIVQCELDYGLYSIKQYYPTYSVLRHGGFQFYRLAYDSKEEHLQMRQVVVLLRRFFHHITG